MKPPLIPFVPLILKGEGGPGGCLHPMRAGVFLLPHGVPSLTPYLPPDLTFLHEGSKTLLDGLVNVEKLVGASHWGLHGQGTPWARPGKEDPTEELGPSCPCSGLGDPGV